RAEADTVDRRRDRDDVSRREPGGAPEALADVARRRVDHLDGSRHVTGHSRKSVAPYSTASAFAAQTSTIVPATPAGTAFIIFSTSLSEPTAVASTVVPTSTNGVAPGAGAR